MNEYIIPLDEIESAMGNIGKTIYEAHKWREIVRCRDCKHYYEVDEYHPNGNYDRRCCKYFDSYDNEVEPDGFCKWGERDA